MPCTLDPRWAHPFLRRPRPLQHRHPRLSTLYHLVDLDLISYPSHLYRAALRMNTSPLHTDHYINNKEQKMKIRQRTKAWWQYSEKKSDTGIFLFFVFFFWLLLFHSVHLPRERRQNAIHGLVWNILRANILWVIPPLLLIKQILNSSHVAETVIAESNIWPLF